MRLTIFKRQNLRKFEDFSCGISVRVSMYLRVTTVTTENTQIHRATSVRKFNSNTCHIHEATELALRAGKRLEHNAIPTDRYNDLDGAWRCLVKDHNIVGIDSPN